MKNYLIQQYSSLEQNLSLPIIYGSSNIVDLFRALKIPLKQHQDCCSHPYKTTVKHLNNFIEHIIQFPYGRREEMYNFQKGYMWGIDKAFLNIATLSEKFNSPYITPSNGSLFGGFFLNLIKNL